MHRQVNNRPAKFPTLAIIGSLTPIAILVPHCKQPHVYPQAEAPQDRPVALVSLSKHLSSGGPSISILVRIGAIRIWLRALRLCRIRDFIFILFRCTIQMGTQLPA